MNTYILLAPDYSQIDNIHCDYRYFHAYSLEHAKEQASHIWRCDPEDMVHIISFPGQQTAMPH